MIVIGAQTGSVENQSITSLKNVGEQIIDLEITSYTIKDLLLDPWVNKKQPSAEHFKICSQA
ncbi:MAG: hypothetical protein IPN26_10225 [Bacteroidetes bacterium]|nr:hypothetical protein [Bacteroidota bacterium]